MVRLSASPDLWMADGFVDADGCARLAQIAREATPGEEAGYAATRDATGHCQEITIDGVPELEALRERIETLFGVQSDLFETFRYRRYSVGEGHPPHLDCYAFEGRELIATALLSLQDTLAGGETDFPAAGIAVQPRRGRLVCWYNHREDGSRDPRSRHAGLPVREGEKEVLLYFIYKPAEVAAYRPSPTRWTQGRPRTSPETPTLPRSGMPDPAILVLTASTLRDEGVDKVCAALARRGRRVIRLDTARFPLLTHISLDLDGTVFHDGAPFRLDDVGAVWHRHADIGADLGDRIDPMWKEVIERQSEIGLLELAADLPCLHVDHPDRTDTVPGSIGLLRLARAAGLDVPRTLVSNHPDDIRAFVAGCTGGAIRKMLHSSSMIVQTDEGEQRGTTEAVTDEDLLDDATLAACPMVWQERVPKERELRITVVGRRLFVASVRSAESAVGNVDWRKDPALVRGFVEDLLPEAVEAAIHRLMDRLRLNFGTLDIIRTPDDRYVFLEVNTVSFFDFVERATGMPIAEEIARLLCGEAPARVTDR